MLSVFDIGTEVDASELWSGCQTNKDGFGWAIASQTHGLIVGRSMNPADALEDFVLNRTRHIDSPAMFHSRWGTHGAYGLENVHPFPVGGDELTVLAHNGIMPRSFHPRAGDRRSDTAKFADALPFIGHIDDEAASLRISQVLGRGNKVAILTVNPIYQHGLYLWGEAQGEYSTASGAWHSNSDYLPNAGWNRHEALDTPRDNFSSLKALMPDTPMPEDCPFCGERGGSDEEWRVWNCCPGSPCHDCGNGAKYCSCFDQPRETENWWNAEPDSFAWEDSMNPIPLPRFAGTVENQRSQIATSRLPDSASVWKTDC